MIRETDLLAWLQRGGLSLPPVELRVLEIEPAAAGAVRPDAVIEARWGGDRARFLAEVKTLATPKALRQGIAQAIALAR